MTVQFISGFAKKENSTKRPEGIVSMSLYGTLKMPCSIMEPVIAIERLANDANPHIYTYAVIPNFGRFYFVEDWIWANGLWEVHLKEDVLATWKPDIGRQREYILRTDSTTDFDGYITDIMYPATADVQDNTFLLSNCFTDNINVGCYIVGIISGTDTEAVGAISYYAMTRSEFGALKRTLFSDDNLNIMDIIDQQGQLLIQDVSKEVFMALYNPYQYIVSCMWFPFDKTAIPDYSPVTQIQIGWWTYTLNADRIYAQTTEIGTEEFVITNHPQHLRGEYLNYAPFTKRTIFGRFGSIPIDTFAFKVGDSLSVDYIVDLITGQCLAQIHKTDRSVSPVHIDVLTQTKFLLGVPIQIAQVGIDYAGTFVSALDTTMKAADEFVTGDVFGTIASGVSGIYDTLRASMPQLMTGGQNGSFIAPTNQTRVREQFFMVVDEDITHKGRPLCSDRRIDELDGFILCADGETDIACFDNERQAIARYLTSGFFWE